MRGHSPFASVFSPPIRLAPSDAGKKPEEEALMDRHRLTPPAALPLPLILFSLLLLFTSGVLAQTGRGTLAGRVTDVSGAVLQGARAELQPLGVAAVSNGQGEFSILNVPAGSYTLNVSYVGFSVFTHNVVVKAGETARVDAVLKVGSKDEEVTVTTDRQFGEAEAINRERVADNILQVLPVEIITSLPNTNIADALGRLPSVTLERDEGEGKYVQIRGLEPRLANVTINGINVPSPEGGVRQIKLDVVPANLVDSVEINKTLSANQDGEGIGGSVNLVTKTAQNKPTFYLNGYGGYNPIRGGRNSYDIDGVIGKRFGGSKKFGLLFGSSYDWNGRGIDDVEPSPAAIQCDPGPTGCDVPSANAPFAPTVGAQDLRFYSYYRSRYGFTGSTDYKLNDPLSGLYARFIYSHFNNFGDRSVYSPAAQSTTDPNDPNITHSGFLTPTLTDTNATSGYNASVRRPVEVIGSLDLGGKHVFTRWMLAYDFSIARSASEDHGYSQANFSTNSSYQYNIDTSDPLVPRLIPVDGYSHLYDASQYLLANGDVSKTYSPQLNLATGFSAQRNYTWLNRFSTFDFGFKFRNAHKFQDTVDNFYNADQTTNPAAVTLTSFLGSPHHSDFYGGRYGGFGPTADFAKIRNFVNSSPLVTPDLNATDQATIPNNYDLIEKITAGYLMDTMQFGRTRVQAGVRFEGTNESILGNLALFDQNSGALLSVSPIHQTSSYLDVLPSVQVRFDLGHDTDLRVSYGRGIARPNFSDLPPSISTLNFTTQVPEIDAGNPNLKPTRANNYDILAEKYLKPLGLLQGGFFYKTLSDPIYSNRLNITQDFINKNPQFANFLNDFLVQPNNGSGARVWGFEMSYIQQFSFLPGFLGGLGFSGNYGYTHSSTDGVFGRTDHPALQRQAPNTWNISPTYDRGRLSMRLGISYNDANIFQYHYSNFDPTTNTTSVVPLGIRGPNGDVYLYAHTQVDAQGSFRMYKNLQLVISGLNLTNEVFGFYQGSQIYPIQREFYRPTYAFGLRYTLGGELK
jgi:TonB-dependent receptor